MMMKMMKMTMMCSLKASFSLWMFVILHLHFIQGLSNETDGTSSNSTNIASSSSTNSITTTITPSTNESVSPPTYVVTSTSGQPCLLATFNITIRVSYYVTASESKRKYLAFKDIHVPDLQDTFSSICGQNESSLYLDWDNSIFNLNMTFVSHGKSEESVYTNWTLDSISVGYNLSNLEAFPGSSKDGYVTVDKEDLELFNTAIGHTKECDKRVEARLGRRDTSTIVMFDYVKLAAFNLTSDAFPDEIEQCQLNSSPFRDEDILVPLIIACALSFVIIVVVVAYAISRKVQEARDQSQYKPMP